MTGSGRSLVLMERIFISSLARGEMGAIRKAARAAVESLEMVPVMFETGAATDEASRRALLDRVAASDAMVLLLGAEYGEPLSRGMSPTEEEFNEARERGIAVLALVQNVERGPEQEAFLQRVRGEWERGRLTADFTDASDVGLAVVRALNAWRREQAGSDLAPAAEARALELARGPERAGVSYGGSKLRVVSVPVIARPVLDAVALRDAALVDDLVAAARASRLVPNTIGVEPTVSRDSITLALQGGRGFENLRLTIGFNGSVVGEGPVGGDGLLGGSAVMHDRAREIIARTMAFAEAVLRRVDARDEVRDLLVTTAVPEAESKVYALAPIGNAMSMGGMMGSMPHVLIAPEPPLRLRRTDLSRAETIDRLQAELHRRFEVERAVHPPADQRRSDFWR